MGMLHDYMPVFGKALAYRLLPFIAYVFWARVSPSFRFAFILLSTLFSLAAYRNSVSELLAIALYYAYYFLSSLLLYKLVNRSIQNVSRLLLFVLVVTLFLGLPSVLLPMGPTADPLTPGWDLALSGYSYACTAPSSRATNDRVRDYFVFMLVNPVVVFADRGSSHVPAGWNASGILRFLMGAAMLLPWIASRVWLLEFGTRTQLDARTFGGLCLVAAFASGMLLSQYLGQSAVASIQIGLMRQFGHRIPERFDSPLSAVSPADFWRRWNTYIGAWVRCYIFFPIATHRRFRSERYPQLSKAIAVIAGFTFIGWFHDVFMALVTHRPDVRWTTGFIFAGIFTLIWSGANSVLREVSKLVTVPLPTTFLSRICLAAGLIVSVVCWI